MALPAFLLPLPVHLLSTDPWLRSQATMHLYDFLFGSYLSVPLQLGQPVNLYIHGTYSEPPAAVIVYSPDLRFAPHWLPVLFQSDSHKFRDCLSEIPPLLHSLLRSSLPARSSVFLHSAVLQT